MEQLTVRARVREQYRTESRLETCRSVWRPAADGRSPLDAAAAAVGADVRGRILEVGCGTGAFTARVAAEHPAATLIASDRSESFVRLTADLGLRAVLADVHATLARHFGDVNQEDIATRAVADDHASAVSYLATFDESLAASLALFEGPREYAGATTVFAARP